MDLNIRDFPDDLAHKIKVIAAIEGITLREFMIELVKDTCLRFMSSKPGIVEAINKKDE